MGKIQTLLDEHHRVRTRLAHITQPLPNEDHIIIGQGIHLRVMPIRDRSCDRSIV